MSRAKKKDSESPKEIPGNLLTIGETSEKMTSDPAKERSLKRAKWRYDLKRPSRLEKLGISLEAYRAAPKISPILREIQGGKAKALKAMRFSESPLILQFFAVYDALAPRDRDYLSLEAIAISGKINILHLWGEIQFAMREHSVNSVKVIAIANHPEITKKRVEYAQTPGGYRDRDALDVMLGALPSNKGISILNKIFTGDRKEESEAPESPAQFDDDMDVIFPDVTAMQERVQGLRQRALPGK
jgi:hypothetical protein